MELRRRPDDVERRRAAEDVVGVEHRVHAGLLELLVLERRRAEVRGDLGLAGQERRLRIRVRHRHGELIELVLLALAERLLGGHLQRHRLDRDLHRRQRDLVLVGEVLDRLDVRVARDEVERHRVDRRHRLHVEIARGASPTASRTGRRRPRRTAGCPTAARRSSRCRRRISTQPTLTSTPAAFACFSISFWSSMIISGR